MRHLVLLACLAAGSAHAAAPAFVAPAVPVGTLAVQLCPADASITGTRLVTFGVPFPRGSLTQAQLGTVRVLDGANAEIAAHVEQLTPWRHRSSAALDGTSVRIARVQVQRTFAANTCQTLTLAWGGAARTLDVATLQPPRTGWHAVGSGTFGAGDGVSEPDVYAVLPAAWLSKGVLKGAQSAPFDPSVSLTRDAPATMAATNHWPGYTEVDHALKNNFYSVINQDDPLVTAANQCHYKTDYEPWLYDRSATMYSLYIRSGSLAALREAVRASDFYANHLSGTGYFNLRADDTKYSYVENLAYTAWLTGDTTQLSHVAAVLSAHDSYNDVWQNAPDRFWTERHTAFKLLAYSFAYDLNGGTANRDKVNAMIAELVRHQNGANGAIPQGAGYVDGGFYHYGAQHDSDWDDASFGASSWMSVLVVDALLHAYATGEDAATANLVRRLGNFLRVSIVSTLDHQYDTYDGELASPRYAVLSDGTDGQRDATDVEHALDVAAGLAWAGYFADLTNQPDARLRQAAAALYLTYDEGVNFWTRPGGPAAGLTAFRVSPWRKWGWEHRVSTGFAWAMNAGSDVIFANGFQ